MATVKHIGFAAGVLRVYVRSASAHVDGTSCPQLGSLGYVVCTTPRTGSSVLCDALGETGRAGRPAEYFDIHEANRNFWRHELKIDDPSQYLQKVIDAGTSQNGVFGLKLHWHQVTALMSTFGVDPRGIDIDARLASRFQTRRYIWLRRRNKVAQAISNYRAITSTIWRVGPHLKPEIPREVPKSFNLERIEHFVALVEHFDRQWETWFKLSKQQALVVIYEDFCEQYEQTIRAICAYLGVGAAGFRVPEPRFEQQAGELSLEWEAEYRRIKSLPTSEDIALLRPSPQIAIQREPPVRASHAPESQAREEVAAPLAVRANTDHLRLGEKIVAYDVGGSVQTALVAAPSRRNWMDATPQRFAYRCLPLTIANQHGWLMLASHRIEAVWTGSDAIDGIAIRQSENAQSHFAVSHFGHGILTFTIAYLFRTPPGINLHVRGPANNPKDGISALEGIVEADWSEATFTMNWKFTRPNATVVFEADEPIAMISPVRRGDIESFRPEIHLINSEATIDAGYKAWAASRSEFNRGLREGDPGAKAEGWQRHYIRGETLSRSKATSHQTKLFVSDFEDFRSF